MASSTPKTPSSAVSSLLCFVLVGGGSGLLHEWFDWIHFMGFVRFLAPDGYEVHGYVVMVVLGLVIGAAGDTVARRGHGRATDEPPSHHRGGRIGDLHGGVLTTHAAACARS